VRTADHTETSQTKLQVTQRANVPQSLFAKPAVAVAFVLVLENGWANKGENENKNEQEAHGPFREPALSPSSPRFPQCLIFTHPPRVH
jgi:hypothetical protein